MTRALGAAVLIVGSSVAAASLFACAGDERSPFDGSPTNDDAAEGPAPPGAFGDAAIVDAGAGEAAVVFYAHTNTSLFRVRSDDPSLAVDKLGDFDCVDQSAVMTDVAVDAEGRVAGVSQRAVYLDMKVEQGVVRCGPRVDIDASAAFYGAAFAPKGVLASAEEPLIVAGADGDLRVVDRTTGELRVVGHFGDVPADDGNGHTYRASTVGKRWELSGDIVFLDNGGAPTGFATVRDCPSPPSTDGCNRTDTLVEIDPRKLSVTSPGSIVTAVRGLVVKGQGCSDTSTGYGSVYGVAAYGGDVIGFSRSRPSGQGEAALVIRISNADGTACLVSDRTAVTGKGWAGAGVTTLAPIDVPGPK